MNLNITPDSSYKVGDHISGFTQEELDDMVTEAEAGYDIAPDAWLEGPASMLHHFPQEIRAAIIQVCLDTNQSPNDVIKSIVVEHFHG
ncbi:hypothetical protein [Corynebacterium lowii]|uniref:Uncharacterized protein n=1 Tax=Corynebacterium lowii TaxID=1544413 RepID=A0A0Q0UMI8_9CORY|nr:hypothetical protein [Corynebacterium lowii]KQB87611.1 hypothetical protein Clow_00671 [Corynebacterium lowii]MDP9851792.1 hypothetical protein [Corynebacterium lowii]